MEGVVMCWIGERDAEPGLVESVCAHVRHQLREPVSAGFEPERPAKAWDARRKQYETGVILKWLEERHAGAAKVLGVTDVDLFIPILTFVFGEAQLGGRAAVVSTARLTPRDGSREAGRILAERLRKEALHELGHAYGLVHCGAPACVMGRSPGVAEIDTKGDSFCPDCRLLYDDARRHTR
jgi:archaemetzincin